MPSLNVRDAEEMAHSAAIDLERWGDEFEEEWMRPEIEMQQAQIVEQVLVMCEQFPPEMKAMMEKKNPERYAQWISKVAQLKKAQKRG